MEKNPFNEKEHDFFFPQLSINEKYNFEMLKMNDNLSLDNEIKSNLTSFSFIDTQNFKNFDIFKFKNLNQTSDIISIDTNSSKNKLQKKEIFL